MEVGLELGIACERFAFPGAPMDMTTLPVALTVRYSLLSGSFAPYVGDDAGY
jgi:hypothetical protein